MLKKRDIEDIVESVVDPELHPEKTEKEKAVIELMKVYSPTLDAIHKYFHNKKFKAKHRAHHEWVVRKIDESPSKFNEWIKIYTREVEGHRKIMRRPQMINNAEIELDFLIRMMIDFHKETDDEFTKTHLLKLKVFERKLNNIAKK